MLMCMRNLPLLLILIPALLFAAPHKHVRIAITPISATLLADGTQQFTANVSGTSNTTVTWSATAGTVTNGLFTAPSVTQTTTVYVKATSAADSTTTATAAITVDPTPTAQHTVDLNWSPSTSANITGYNVYRGTNSGGPYSQINSGGLVASTLYMDASVASGQTYYYVVTAVNSSAIEGADSNQAQAVVPSP